MILVELNWGRINTQEAEPDHNGPVILCDVFKETWANCILIEDHLQGTHDIRYLFDDAFAFGDHFYSDIVIHAQDLETRTFITLDMLPQQHNYTVLSQGLLLGNGQIVVTETTPKQLDGICQIGDEYVLCDEGSRHRLLSAPARTSTAIA